jgi:hypothetical protein
MRRSFLVFPASISLSRFTSRKFEVDRTATEELQISRLIQIDNHNGNNVTLQVAVSVLTVRLVQGWLLTELRVVGAGQRGLGYALQNRYRFDTFCVTFRHILCHILSTFCVTF